MYLLANTLATNMGRKYEVLKLQNVKLKQRKKEENRNI